jgi:hypothetical protein
MVNYVTAAAMEVVTEATDGPAACVEMIERLTDDDEGVEATTSR